MKSSLSLTPETTEKLGYYVYILRDPRNGKIFYIGKGKGSRIYSHLIHEEFAKIGDIKNSKKLKTIRAIKRKKLKVILEILRHGLTEKESLEIEGACIDLFPELTNKVKGHGSNDRGIMTIEEIKLKYEAEEAVIDDPVIMITINKLYHRGITEEALYESTRKYWHIRLEKGEKAKYVFGVYQGIVRAVYEPVYWKKILENQLAGRSYFAGKVARKEALDKYLKKSVRKYIKHGSQNPIKYINL